MLERRTRRKSQKGLVSLEERGSGCTRGEHQDGQWKILVEGATRREERGVDEPSVMTAGRTSAHSPLLRERTTTSSPCLKDKAPAREARDEERVWWSHTR
eukprot:2339923-Rhodomonas_salina.2